VHLIYFGMCPELHILKCIAFIVPRFVLHPSHQIHRMHIIYVLRNSTSVFHGLSFRKNILCERNVTKIFTSLMVTVLFETFVVHLCIYRMYIKMSLCHSMLSWTLVTTAWHILGLQMDKMASRCGR
jgi:hypothetical protein